MQQLEFAETKNRLTLTQQPTRLMAEGHDVEAAWPSKKARRECKYQHEWQSHGIFRSCKGKNFALCKTCNVDIYVSCGGISDVRKHLATTKHQQLVKAAGNSVDLRKFMPQSPIEDAVTRSEVLFANFIAEHNLSFSTANHFSHLTRVMFPDSKIARAFKSARTKTICIIKHALNPHFIDPVLQHCQNFNLMR